MKQFKLNFGNRSALEQIAISRRVADSIARLPAEQQALLANHPVAQATQEAADACAEVEAAKTILKAALHQRKDKLATMRHHTTYAALGIHNQTAGEPVAMLAAGLEVVKDKSPVGIPAAPGQLRALATDFEGTVRLRWKRPVRRCGFMIQHTTDPAATTGWQNADTSIRQSCEVTGLQSGQKYWFRVAAANAHGQGPWSQVVSVRVK